MSCRIDPHLPVTAEVRRIAAGEIDAILSDLQACRSAPETGLHECRKRFKRLRALLRLVQSGDEPFCEAENARYRDVARTLAGPRAATALVETVDRLVAAFPGKAGSGELDTLRAALVARRDTIAHERAGLEETIAAAIASCERGRAALAHLALPDEPQAAADMLADGAAKTMRRIRRALDAARKRGRPEDFHDLRKAIKMHAVHVGLLHHFWPRPVRKRREALDRIGERLGELNDLFVMREFAGSSAGPLVQGEALALLLRLVTRSEKSLRKSCLDKAEKLFDAARRPGRKKIARRYQAAASGPESTDA